MMPETPVVAFGQQHIALIDDATQLLRVSSA